jgi:hypothetical protein
MKQFLTTILNINLNFTILISSTISGFNKVEVSPSRIITFGYFTQVSCAWFSWARFGKPETNCILSNLAMGPIWLETCWLISFLRFSRSRYSPLSFRITNPYKAFPLISWGKPTIADSATAGCSFIASSIGAVPDYDQKHYYIIHSACDSVISYFVT